jgi:hypothetical protein
LAATHPVQLKAAGAKSPAKNAASRDLLRRSGGCLKAPEIRHPKSSWAISAR